MRTTVAKVPVSQANQKNILLLLWAGEGSGRDFLIGFSNHYRRKANWNVNLLYNTNPLLPDTIRQVKDGYYDGIAMTEAYFYDHPELSGPPKTALAVFGVYEPGHPKAGNRIGYVSIDNAELGRIAARHFLDLGRFRSFCYMPPPFCGAWISLREQGFREELAKNGLSCHAFDYTQSIASFLKPLPPPVGMFVACDYTAVEVLSACKQAGYDIPAKLSILSVDNDEILCHFAQPTLSSLRPSNVKAGEETAVMLDRLMRKVPAKTPLFKVCPDCTIVERETTRYVSPSSHLVEKALAAMKENLAAPLHVDKLAEQLGVSRRLLDLRFKELQGESVYSTYLKLKLDEIAKRLLTSSVSIGKTASSLNFYDMTQLGRLFKRRFGVTMSEWRSAQIPSVSSEHAGIPPGQGHHADGSREFI